MALFIFVFNTADLLKFINNSPDISLIPTAFKIWSGYTRLNFVEVHSPDADIVVLFGKLKKNMPILCLSNVLRIINFLS